MEARTGQSNGIEVFRSYFDAIEGLAGKEVFLVSLCQVVNARLVA